MFLFTHIEFSSQRYRILFLCRETGVSPHPNFSFSLAQRKEVKETSTPTWTLPLYGEGNCKSRIRDDFQISLRLALKLAPLRGSPGFFYKAAHWNYQGHVIKKDIASSRDTKRDEGLQFCKTRVWAPFYVEHLEQREDSRMYSSFPESWQMWTLSKGDGGK